MRVGTREIDAKLRGRLRARPRLQGAILAPAGATRRLPHSKGALYFPFTMGCPGNMPAASRITL
jgi:hypothetical protein